MLRSGRNGEPLRDRILLGWQVIVMSTDVLEVGCGCNAGSHRCGRPLNADISLKGWRLLRDVRDKSRACEAIAFSLCFIVYF